jgi:hypothetical protein
MASLPTGIGNLPSGIGNFGVGGQYAPNITIPPGGYGALLASLPAAVGALATSKSAPASGAGQSAASAPFDITGPLLQTYGAGSAFNPMTVFDLMNSGAGPLVSPFAGSGLLGYQGAASGGGAGNMVAAAPVPGSGGKGIIG